METEIREPLIRLPRSGPRNAQGYCKLLNRVARNPQMGFDFEGVFLPPGKAVPARRLNPPGYPDLPVLLECAGTLPGAHGHVRTGSLYILWRYEASGWEEQGRANSVAWEWTIDLGPLARRLLSESRTTTAIGRILPDLALVHQRICLALDHELDPLEPEDRLRLVAILHDQLAARFAAAAGW